MDFTPLEPVRVEGNVTVDDMTSFFVQYMKYDLLGPIATAHRYWADQQPDGVKDEKCIRLAHLHSAAVDYAKTGRPAVMSSDLRIMRWPHWAENRYNPNRRTYHSHRVIGQLYDCVQRVAFNPQWHLPFDSRILNAYNLPSDLLTSARILIDHGLPLPAEQIVEILLDGVIEQVREHVPFRPGARALLEELREAGVPCALVTMSYRRLAEAVVEACPAGSFAVLVTGDEVPAGKPDPAPYVLGAEALGLTPGECLALEDSIPGLTSAEAAGTVAVGIPHLVPLPELPGRTLVLSLSGLDLAGLRNLAARAREAQVSDRRS